MMEVKGEALQSIPLFIIKYHGREAYTRWLDALPVETRNIFKGNIEKDDWYPLGAIMSESTRILCKMFYDRSIRGAFESGRFSADYGLKGLKRVLVKLSSPDVLINKASAILPLYYRPSAMEVKERSRGEMIAHITEFPEMDPFIEKRIAGWMSRAVELSGCSNVRTAVTKSLTRGHAVTEYHITWQG